MKIIFLGTGTSTGVPQIACKCDTCTSTDVRDKRLRASVCVETENKTILIDCGPDFRAQMIDHNITELNHILITHGHYDHVGGLDDVRPFGNVTIYAEQNVISQIHTSMPYCFAENPYPGVPKLSLREISEESFLIDGIHIQPIRVMHARLPILGFRIGKMAYLTDLKSIDDAQLKQLEDLDVLILNALRIQTHIAHINIDEAIVLAQKIGAKTTYFTHFSHDAGKHAEIQKKMPSGIIIAHDNLTIEV